MGVPPEDQQIMALLASDSRPNAELMTKGAHAYETGVLTLGARSNESSGDDLHSILQEHEGIIQDVLEARLGSPLVELLRTDVALRRRLQDSDTHVLEVHFRARDVSTSISVANIGLKHALQEAFFVAGVGMMVEFASMRWTSPDLTSDAQFEDNEVSSSMIVGLASAALLAISIVGVCAMIVMKKRAKHPTLADVNAIDEEQKLAGVEVEKSVEHYIMDNPTSTFDLAHMYGVEASLAQEKAAGIDIEKTVETSSSKIECEETWGGNWEEPWEERLEANWEENEGKLKEPWEVHSSSTSEGGTRSQTSGGDTGSESQTNHGGLTFPVKVHITDESDV